MRNAAGVVQVYMEDLGTVLRMQNGFLDCLCITTRAISQLQKRKEGGSTNPHAYDQVQ